MTNHHLKEVYDKYNVFYTQHDFEKVKGKTIGTFEKYGFAIRGVGGFAMYFGIIFMALGANSVVGKRLAITGLLMSIYVVLELKKPYPNAKTLTPAVELFNENVFNQNLLWFLKKWRFPANYVKLEYWTIHQLCNFVSVFWGCYFQFSLALSRLVDVQFETTI